MNSASVDSVEVKILSSKKNRSLIAKKNFSKGDTIFCEKPFVCTQFAWNEFYGYRACEYCMKPLESAEENVRRLTENKSFRLRYNECCETDKSKHTKCPECQIEYCREECRHEAYESYHQKLCLGTERFDPNHPINILMDTWRQIHFPPETTNIMLILKLIAMIKQSSDKNAIIERLSNFQCDLVNETDQIPHKLLNEKFYSAIESLRQLTYDIFRDKIYSKECEIWFDEFQFKKLFCLIGRNSQGVGTSSLSVWVNNCSKLQLNKSEKSSLDSFIDKIYDNLDEVSGTFLNCEGSALYELQSMSNHSCSPNAEVSFKFNNNVLSMVAINDIKEGQEITISYLDECDSNRSRHSRQKILRENYLFVCECERCINEANQADVTSEDDDDYEDMDDDNDEDMES